MKANVLVVEDNDSLRLALIDNLEEEGYRVSGAADGEQAERALSEKTWDLIVLDIMLPDADGYRLCESLRASGSDAMILMLTARTLEDDLVRGFDAGADDYLAKPYRLRELLSRVAALLRRKGVRSDRVVSFGEYTLDRRARRVVTREGAHVELTRTELELLELFVTNVDTAFTRDEILDRVWGEDVVVDVRTVDNFVSSLKRKLKGNGGRRPGFAIRTLRGVGYRMETGACQDGPER